MSSDTHPPITISEKTGLRLPLPLLLTLLGLTAAWAIAWGNTRQAVTRHGEEITRLKEDAQQQREILIRIDERTAEINRRMEQRRP